MRRIIETPTVTWVDMQNPTKDDLQYLKERFNFHPLVLDEIIPPILRTKVEEFPDYLFLVLHSPVYNKGLRETRPQELDIIVTKNAVVTAHYHSILPVKYLFDRCNLYPETKNEFMSKGSGQLLFNILNEFWESSLTKLPRINRKLDYIESAIFKGQQSQMLEEISFTNADIIDFLRIIVPQGDIFDSLRDEGTKFFGEEMEPYFSHLIGHWSQVKNDLQSYKDTVRALEETNNSLLAHKTNEIVRVLTIFSVIVLPAMLIANIFGQNLDHPFINNPYSFWIVAGVMIIGTAAVIGFFKKKGWM